MNVFLFSCFLNLTSFNSNGSRESSVISSYYIHSTAYQSQHSIERLWSWCKWFYFGCCGSIDWWESQWNGHLSRYGHILLNNLLVNYLICYFCWISIYSIISTLSEEEDVNQEGNESVMKFDESWECSQFMCVRLLLHFPENPKIILSSLPAPSQEKINSF